MSDKSMTKKEAMKILEDIKKVLEERSAATGRFVDIKINKDWPDLTFRDLKNEDNYRRFLEKESGKGYYLGEIHPPYGRRISFEDGIEKPWSVYDYAPNEDYSGGVDYRKIESALWFLTVTLADPNWLGGDQPGIYYVEIDDSYENMLLALRLGNIDTMRFPAGPHGYVKDDPYLDARPGDDDFRRWDLDEKIGVGREFPDPRSKESRHESE